MDYLSSKRRRMTRKNAAVTLLRALELSIAASDSQDIRTSKVVQLLIQLYEAWNKPDKAEEWRAKLPRKQPKEQ